MIQVDAKKSNTNKVFVTIKRTTKTGHEHTIQMCLTNDEFRSLIFQMEFLEQDINMPSTMEACYEN